MHGDTVRLGLLVAEAPPEIRQLAITTNNGQNSSMRRLTPTTGFLLVLVIVAGVLVADYSYRGGFRRSGFERVSPDKQGLVKLDITRLAAKEASFYRFLNSGNQEVKFFVARDDQGIVHVAFDAAESDYKLGRGFTVHDGWAVNNKCETSVRLSEITENPGGCRPIPFPFRLEGNTLVLTESDILRGWRYFR